MIGPEAESIDERVTAEPIGPRVGPDIDFTDPNSRFAPYYLQASHIVALLVLVTLFLFFNLLVPLAHSDIWAHLKVGEWIVANGKLPDREMLSPFSDPLQPMANFQWLSQVILYKTFRAGAWLAGGEGLRATEGGVEMLRFLHGILEAAKGWFLLAAFRRWTGSLPFAIAGVVVVFLFSMAPSAIQRPQAFAEVLFACLLWLLSPRVGPMPWTIVAVVTGLLPLWANLHGSFPIGSALIGVVWLGGAVETARTNRAGLLSPAPHRPLFALIAGLALLSLLNPHGWHAIPDVLAFAKNPNVLTMQEWKPLDFSAGSGGHWGYLALLVVITLAQVVSDRVMGPTQILLLLSFGVGPLLQERQMTWWVMLTPVLFLPLCQDILKPLGSWAAQWNSVASSRKTIIAGMVIVVAGVWSSGVSLLLGHPPLPIDKSVSQATFWAITPELLAGESSPEADRNRFETSRLHLALSKALKRYPGGRFTGRIHTAEALGDYLVWSLPPKAPVTVFSHVHVFPPDYWEDHMEVLFARPGWRFVLDRYQVNLVVMQVEQRRDLLEKLSDDPAWEIILDESDLPIDRSYRLFAAMRKKPLE